jgi:hypothetical protein
VPTETNGRAPTARSPRCWASSRLLGGFLCFQRARSSFSTGAWSPRLQRKSRDHAILSPEMHRPRRFFAWVLAAHADRDLVFQECSSRVRSTERVESGSILPCWAWPLAPPCLGSRLRWQPAVTQSRS